MFRIGEPIGAVGGEGPGTHLRDARGERVNVAVGTIDNRHLLGEPILGQAAAAGEKSIYGHNHVAMGVSGDLAIIRQLADLPKPLDFGARGGTLAYALVARRDFEGDEIVSSGRARQAGLAWQHGEASQERLERGEVEI